MFLNNVIRLPYNKIDNSIDLISKPSITHDDKVKFIKNIYEELNNNLFGLDEVKDSIVSFICQKINNPDLPNNKFLCLCGPAGVGKTTIIHIVSNALKIPYSYISMANIDESSILIGHSYTYEGSIPGCIAEALIKNDCLNGILLFDEIDKTKEKIQNILLGIFDPMQNYKFRDAYFGDFHINLSESMMILCLNDLDKVNPILRDRLHVINIPGYSISEKKVIIDTYIIPKLEKQYKLKVNIDSKVIDYILEKTQIHKGIRQIIMNITKIYELCILDKFTNKYNFNNNFNYENISILKLHNDDFKSNMMYI
jgi:ATP-dependent Lon protease